jgi:hypothetical protein
MTKQLFVAGIVALLLLLFLHSALAPLESAAVSAETAAQRPGAVDYFSIPKHHEEKIRAAAPDAPRAKPKQARRVLVFSTPNHLMEKDPHKGYCIPYGAAAMRILGEKTGAYQPVVSNELVHFLPENIKTFDAIVLNNASGEWITPTDDDVARLAPAGTDKKTLEERLRKSLLDYVSGGGGLMAYHFAIGANAHWPEFRELLGATFTGHPWAEEVGFLVEEPDYPLAAAFGGNKHFRIDDEIYQFGPPYDRSKLRVFLSLDTERTDMSVRWIGRDDNDFAQAWVKSHGKGRVFYTGLGHRTEIYWNPVVLRFFLDAVQFATGDLEASTEPRADRPLRSWPGPTPPEVRAARMKAHQVPEPTAEEIAKIEAACPDKPQVKPARPRKVLVWGRTWTHLPNAYAEKTLELLGKKTGAFTAVVSDDPRLLLSRHIEQFDAVVMNNIHEQEPFLRDDFDKLDPQQQAAARKLDQAVKQSILEYVRGGKGLVGTHAATAALFGWEEYGEMIGGYYGGHIHQDVVLKLDDPNHPVNACFEGKPFKIREEIYIFKAPYARKNLRVLLSLDLERMPDPGNRADKDYAVSWVRSYGKGRVFYTNLGHEPATHWNPLFLRHLLAGVQFAIGDLEGSTEPNPK